MKKIAFMLSVAALGACNSGQDAKVESISTTQPASAEKVTLPYDIQYSSNFEIGDQNKSKIILDFWKDWDNGNLANGREKFADSVHMFFADGSVMHAGRDSVLASGQNYRNSLASAVSTVNAVVPLKSTDKNEEWVCVWGKEIDTHKDGKVDSFYLQETWRFNNAGKVDLVYQFIQKSPPPKK